MAWRHPAISRYLSNCCPRSLTQYGITVPQWVKIQTGPLHMMVNIDVFIQEICNSSAITMELRLSCTNPSIYLYWYWALIFVKLSSSLSRYGSDQKCIIWLHILMDSILVISWENALEWMSHDLTDERWVNISAGNGSVLSGNSAKPLPDALFTKFYVAIWGHKF